jgi:hypothetical protein
MNPLNLSIRLIRLVRKQWRPARIPAGILTIPANPEPATGIQASSPCSTHHIPAGNPASTPALFPYRMKAQTLPASAESGDTNRSKPLAIMVCSELSPLPLGIIRMLDLYKKTNH